MTMSLGETIVRVSREKGVWYVTPRLTLYASINLPDGRVGHAASRTRANGQMGERSDRAMGRAGDDRRAKSITQCFISRCEIYPAMLTADRVTKQFGGLTAVDDIDFTIDEDAIVGLIGPNGAGKTTLFNTIAGVYTPDEGSITFRGEEIVGKNPHQIAQSGIARTFQTARTFNESTVLDNVLTGAVFGKEDSGSLSEEREAARQYLEFVGLEDKTDEEAGSLTLADRKQLELAKGLASEPKLILADEIGSGLTPTELEELLEMLRHVRDDLDISVFWIEHVMDAIMSATDRIIVLNQGAKIADGTPEEIQQNRHVEEAYLGSGDS
jgi:branched-chain amino acid transport system ATP-binding protein